MIRIIRVERTLGKFQYPAGDVFDFEKAYDASVFLLGCQISKYLIVKDGYVFKPSTSEVAQIEKELDLFNGAKTTEQATRPPGLIAEWAKQQGFEKWAEDHATVLRNLEAWLAHKNS